MTQCPKLICCKDKHPPSNNSRLPPPMKNHVLTERRRPRVVIVRALFSWSICSVRQIRQTKTSTDPSSKTQHRLRKVELKRITRPTLSPTNSRQRSKCLVHFHPRTRIKFIWSIKRIKLTKEQSFSIQQTLRSWRPNKTRKIDSQSSASKMWHASLSYSERATTRF